MNAKAPVAARMAAPTRSVLLVGMQVPLLMEWMPTGDRPDAIATPA
ncbi:hypothetical protein [Alloactinosynnema sp. L-07]|nr:hypothetical protein [Alloactinosynnema sp. L-07]